MTRPLRLTRELVDLIPSSIEDPGQSPEHAQRFTPEARAALFEDVVRTCPDLNNLWFFAFGSLIWKPACPFVERRSATIEGWHRAFCLGPDKRYRGNPVNPGIMLSLDYGGKCEGVVYRMDPARTAEDLKDLMEREPPIPPIWVTAQTDAGPICALVFVRSPDDRGYIGGMTPNEIARQIAPAVGTFGSMADYVLNTASHLEELGIHDPNVWQMQDLVAAELERLRDTSGLSLKAPQT